MPASKAHSTSQAEGKNSKHSKAFCCTVDRTKVFAPLQHSVKTLCMFGTLTPVDVSLPTALALMRGKNSSFLLRVRASGPAPLLWPVCLPSSRSPDGSRSGLEVLSCVNIRNPIHCQDSLPTCHYEPFHGCNILYSV